VLKVCPACLNVFPSEIEAWDERCSSCAAAGSPESNNRTAQDTNERSISRCVPAATSEFVPEKHLVDLF
jgi:hypothetical protein